MRPSRMVAPGGNPSTCSRWRAADCNACAEDELARPSARASDSAVFQAGARIDANGWPARTGSYGASTNKRSTTASTCALNTCSWRRSQPIVTGTMTDAEAVDKPNLVTQHGPGG